MKLIFLNANYYICTNIENHKVENSSRKISYSTVFFVCTTIILSVLLIINQINKPKERGYDSTTMLSKIVHLQELALVKYNYSGVIGYKDFMKIFNMNVPLTGKYFLFKYNGYIKAGVDFSRIKVDINGKSIHVSIPESTVLDTVIDENSVQVYDESENAFNPIKISDYNKALMKEKSTMQHDAIKQGILKQADEQAEIAIKALLKEIGFESIQITQEISIPPVH